MTDTTLSDSGKQLYPLSFVSPYMTQDNIHTSFIALRFLAVCTATTENCANTNMNLDFLYRECLQVYVQNNMLIIQSVLLIAREK